MKWGFPDDRVLPRSASAHQVGDRLRNDFAARFGDVGARRHPRRPRPESGGLRHGTPPICRGFPTCRRCRRPTGTFVDGNRGRDHRPAATGLADGSAFLTVSSTAPLFSAGVRHPAQAVARGARARGPIRRDGRARTGQPRQRRCGDGTASAGAGADGRDHLRVAVPAHRQRAAAGQGARLQRPVADRGVRRAGVDLPGRPSRCAGNHAERDAGGQHAGAAVLHRLRAVDGLRGVPALPDPRVLAGVRRRPTGHGRPRSRPTPPTTRAWRSASPAPVG